MGARRLYQLSDHEWHDFLADFADLLLEKYRLAGSVAGVYSLYDALDQERERALEQGPLSEYVRHTS